MFVDGGYISFEFAHVAARSSARDLTTESYINPNRSRPVDEHILGAHLLGPRADDVINLFALAMRTGATASMLKKTRQDRGGSNVAASAVAAP